MPDPISINGQPGYSLSSLDPSRTSDALYSRIAYFKQNSFQNKPYQFTPKQEFNAQPLDLNIPEYNLRFSQYKPFSDQYNSDQDFKQQTYSDMQNIYSSTQQATLGYGLKHPDKGFGQQIVNTIYNSNNQLGEDTFGKIESILNEKSISQNTSNQNNTFDINNAKNAIWSAYTVDNANQLFGDSKLGQVGTALTGLGTQTLSLWNSNKLASNSTNVSKPISAPKLGESSVVTPTQAFNQSVDAGVIQSPDLGTIKASGTEGISAPKSSLASQAKGVGAGMAASMATNFVGNKVFGDSAGGQIATGALSSAAGTAAGAVANGQKIASAFSNAGSLTSAGIGVANIALDVLDPVRKAKWENAANMAAGAAMLIPGVGWAVGAGILAFNAIGHLGGKKADTITKDTEAFEKSMGSYGATENTVNRALQDSGAKYSMWANADRKAANRRIGEATRQQNLLRTIVDNAEDRRLITQSMSAINGNRYGFQLQGNYNQSAIRAGKHGMILQDLQRAKRIVSSMKYQKGGQVKDLFTAFISTLPDNQKPTKDGGFNVKRYWELNGKPKNFKEAIERGMYSQQEDGWHAHTVQYNPEADEYEFMKSSTHPTLQYELDWYNSNDPEATEFRSQYELQKTEPYYKYVRRKGTDQPQAFKQGGNLSNWLIEIDINNIPTEFRDFSLQEVSIDNILPEFKEGGKFNIIPEGALHARKHNMEIDGITSKGIPVVSQSEGGEIQQQAEIEREEVILRLEVTKKLEELCKKYYDSETKQVEKDDCALEAGQLLVKELLYNTKDNTGLINNI